MINDEMYEVINAILAVPKEDDRELRVARLMSILDLTPKYQPKFRFHYRGGYLDEFYDSVIKGFANS